VSEVPALLHERHDDVVVVRLNRPAQRNAMSSAMGVELEASLNDLAGARALVVTGDEVAFSAGADLKELGAGPDREAWHRALPALAALPIPTIAAIEGWCLGGGLELALACDLRVSSTDAVLGFPEVLRGIFPGGGGTQRLPRAIGVPRAKQLMMLGQPVTGEVALDWGLVNETVPPGHTLVRALELATGLAAGPAPALAAIKELTDLALDVPLSAGLDAEHAAIARVLSSAEAHEGVGAFRERHGGLR